MKKWKTQHKLAGTGMGVNEYVNQVVAPDGTTFTVNCQDVITGRVKTEPLPVSHYGPGYIRQTLVDETGNKPLPDPLCEFIVSVCNAAL